MLKNLSEVFGERDSERRMAAIKNNLYLGRLLLRRAQTSPQVALSKQIEILRQLEDDMQRAQAYIKRVAATLQRLQEDDDELG